MYNWILQCWGKREHWEKRHDKIFISMKLHFIHYSLEQMFHTHPVLSYILTFINSDDNLASGSGTNQDFLSPKLSRWYSECEETKCHMSLETVAGCEISSQLALKEIHALEMLSEHLHNVLSRTSFLINMKNIGSLSQLHHGSLLITWLNIWGLKWGNW